MKWDWKAVVGVLISLFLIWWVLRGVDPAEVWAEVRGTNWWLLSAAVAVATSGFFTRALRWRVFLHPVAPGTSLRNRFAAVNIGFATNNLLPARVGEFARAWSISRLEPVPVSGAIGSLVVERFMDGVGIFLLLVAALLHPSFPDDATVAGQPIGTALVAILAIMAGGILLLSSLIAFPNACLRLFDRILRYVPGRHHEFLRELMESFLQGLTSLRDPGLLARGLAWSIGIWAWNAVSFWLAFLAFGIDEGYFAALFVQGIIALGVAVPSAPGYFGTFHAAAVIGLTEVYRVGEGATLAFAFGYHLGGFFPVTVIGLWYAGRLGMSLGQLGHAEEAVESELHEEHVPGRPTTEIRRSGDTRSASEKAPAPENRSSSDDGSRSQDGSSEDASSSQDGSRSEDGSSSDDRSSSQNGSGSEHGADPESGSPRRPTDE